MQTYPIGSHVKVTGRLPLEPDFRGRGGIVIANPLPGLTHVDTGGYTITVHSILLDPVKK